MLTHIVVWKYRSDVSAGQREEHVAMLRRLPNLIPDVVNFSVGSDVLGLPRSYDTGLVAVFSDRVGLDAYTVHPEHVAVADFGKRVSAHVASVDFES
ncbi:MAG: Dabb family protein [Pyrinomonadaceae bacterium]